MLSERVKQYTCNEWMKEGNVLFNDALNTFYLRIYCVGHMVKDHSDSERGNPLPPHGLLFPNSSKGSFICTIPQTGYHIPRPFYTSRGALAGTINISMGPPQWRIDPATHRTMSERSYYMEWSTILIKSERQNSYSQKSYVCSMYVCMYIVCSMYVCSMYVVCMFVVCMYVCSMDVVWM